MIFKAYKYRINPTKDQSILIDKHIGSCRFVYNLALETKEAAYSGSKSNLSCFDLINQLPDLKKECKWLKEVNSQSLQASIHNLDAAYKNFFKGKSNFPKYKSKKNRSQSFSIPQHIKIKSKKLIIPKFSEGIDIVLHRTFNGKVIQCVISKSNTGKYFASIFVRTNDELIPRKSIEENSSIGIDLGIKYFLVTSNGDKINNPKFLKKSLLKIKFTQRKFSRSKGKKTKLKLQRLHEKVTNKRKDFLHKVSSDLIKNHNTIALETLKVKNMVKNHNLSQAILDASWGMFVEMVEYKANWYGVNIIKIGAFEPSSKTCSKCGYINKELRLSDREWICGSCNSTHDRDINASVNIKNFALRNMCTEYTHKIMANCLH